MILERPSATRRAAEYCSALRYDDLPWEVISTVKAILLDTQGTSLAAGSLGAGCTELVSVARASGGTAESTVIGFGDRVPAPMAALVNGGLAHALNYDAVGAAHLGLIPVAPLAVAEREGSVSGRELITAMAAGCELVARLGAAIGSGHPTVLLGQMLSYFGAAVASARIMRLTASATHSALGLALMQAAGSRQVVIEGDPPSKAIYGSFPCQGGVLSALLAQEGLDAACDALEGEAGLPALVAGNGQPRPEIDADFGSRFYLLAANFKPWPTSGHVTPFIEAALEIAKSQSMRPAEIAHVNLRAAPAVRAWFEPAAGRKRPRNSPAAANSVYFCVAKALVNGEVTLGDFTPSGIEQKESLAFTDRMEHTLEDGPPGAGTVELTTQDGAVHSMTIATPLGSPARAMSWDRLVAKFRDCARYAPGPIPKARLDQAIALVEHLERVPDVGILPGLLRVDAGV